MNAIEQRELDRDGVSIERWGKDHWSTFAYIESICVDSTNGVGRVGDCKVQTNFNRHPELAYMSVTMVGTPLDGSLHSIRLADGVELPGPAYDEWDCIKDFERYGLVVEEMMSFEPAYRMTRLGNLVAGKVRAVKTLGGNYQDVRIDADELEKMKKLVQEESNAV